MAFHKIFNTFAVDHIYLLSPVGKRHDQERGRIAVPLGAGLYQGYFADDLDKGPWDANGEPCEIERVFSGYVCGRRILLRDAQYTSRLGQHIASLC